MCIRKKAVWIVAICLASTVALEAQRGDRRGGMGGGATPEQVFVLLAFEEKFEVNDKQLLALRAVLGPLYVEQRQMMAAMFSGRGGETDFRAMREKMRDQQSKMREQVMAALATVLSAEQVEALKGHLQQQRASQRGGPQSGGGPGGGGF